jgi:hypothetical protein
MVSTRTLSKRLVGRVNAGVLALRDAPVAGPLIRRRITTVTYTGRRSGRTFTTPVGYRRRDDEVLVVVELPDMKTWWRNFDKEERPVTLDLPGGPRTGLARARRISRGRAAVVVRLTGPDQ